jgi:tetratricopeptide (TPR) repeat protein
LMAEIWPDTFVEENNLTVTVSALRKALGEPRSGHSYIQTIPRRGYRFAASVRRSVKTASLALYRPSAEADSEILVGREPELRKLECWLSLAIEGAGRVIFITGEPGIGKTALSNAFFNRARLRFRAARFCRGRCLEQYGSGEPYLPILEALSELLSGPDGEFVADVLRSRAPTWCLQFPAVFGLSDSMERLYRETVGATKERMLREMVDALGALASDGPVVLHIEDLHWVDHSSIDLLGRLSQDAGEQRLLVTGTFRPEDVDRANHPFKNFLLEMQAHSKCEELALGMLSQEHLATYLDSRFTPNRFDPGFPGLIHRRTEGQPLFATSLVQFLVERNDIAKLDEEWILTRPLSELGMEAPGNVRKLIRKKIDALDTEDRRALEFASIQGEVFTSAVLAGLLEVDDLALEERLDRLDKVHRLIQTTEEDELPDGTLTTRYRFAHVLYQNSLYNDLVSKRRVLLHRQAGDLMIRFYGDQAPRFAGQLAVHFERGRDFGRAVEFLVHAGDNGRHVNANDKAVEHYSHALTLVSRLPLEQQTPGLLTIYQKRGAAYLAMGQFDQAVEDFTNLLHQARATSDRRSEHSGLNSLAEVFFYSHRLDELDDCTGEALHIAKDLGDDRLRVETMVFIAMRQDIIGELVEAKQNLDQIIRIARDLDDKRALLDALAWRGQLYFFQSEYECAREALLEALDLASALRHGPLLFQSQFFLGLTLGNMGRISESLARLQEVGSMARRNGNCYWQAKVPNSIGWIHRELQNFDHALKCDQEGLEVARTNKVSEAETNSLINLGCDRIHTEDSERALKSFGEAEAILESDVWCRWRFTLRFYEGLSALHLAAGELDESARYAKLLLESATHYEARKYVAVAHKLLAEVAIARCNPENAEAELRAALDMLAAHPVPLIAWKIHSMLGHVRLRMKDGLAAEAFENASAVVETIAANVADESLRTSFLGAPAVQDVFVRQRAAEPGSP